MFSVDFRCSGCSSCKVLEGIVTCPLFWIRIGTLGSPRRATQWTVVGAPWLTHFFKESSDAWTGMNFSRWSDNLRWEESFIFCEEMRGDARTIRRGPACVRQNSDHIDDTTKGL